MKQPTLEDVRKASERIYQYVRQTPLVPAERLAELSGAKAVACKLEMLQPTGSFKVRGAANSIMALSDEQRARGIITFSTGNHGLAVSYIAGKMGVLARVCLSKRVPAYRSEAIRALGGTPEIWGESQDEAEARYHDLMRRDGQIPIVPFDDPRVIAGQGTIGLELTEQSADADTILVPLSGGGLLAGIAMAVKSLRPEARIVSISIKRSPVMLRSLQAGCPVELPEQDTLADSLLGGVGQDNRYTMPLVERFVDEHVVVGENDLKEGMYYAFRELGVVAEGAAAAPLGAILSGKVDVRNRSVVTIVTGCNVEVSRYLSVISEKEREHETR